MDKQNFENQTFGFIPCAVICSNFKRCTFNSPVRFEKCNLIECTFNAECVFEMCNVIDHEEDDRR